MPLVSSSSNECNDDDGGVGGGAESISLVCVHCALGWMLANYFVILYFNQMSKNREYVVGGGGGGDDVDSLPVLWFFSCCEYNQKLNISRECVCL